jgi:hypothetical protein
VPHFPSQIQDFDTLHPIARADLGRRTPPRLRQLSADRIHRVRANQPTAIYLLSQENSDNFILDMMRPVEAAKTQLEISYQFAGLHFDLMLDHADNFQGNGVNARAKGIVVSYKQKLDSTITNEINRRSQERLRLRVLPYPYFLPANIPNGTSV